jgi:hypothetical protein
MMEVLRCEAESTVFADGVDTGLSLLEVAAGDLTFYQCCWVDACSQALTLAAEPGPEIGFGYGIFLCVVFGVCFALGRIWP